MKEMAIGKINRMGKVSCVLTTVCKVFVIIGMVLTLGLGLISYLIPDELFVVNFSGQAEVIVDIDTAKSLDKDLDVKDLDVFIRKVDETGYIKIDGEEYTVVDARTEDNKFIVDSGTAGIGQTEISSIRKLLFVVTAYLALVLVTLFCIGSLSKAVKDCESPFEEGVIKKLRIFSYSLFPWVVMDSVMSACMNIFMKGSSNMTINVNVGMLMVVLTVYGLTYIFKYGAMLQQESDETL